MKAASRETNRNSGRATTATSLGRVGSGNVFADLGLPNSDEELFKARLVSKIADVIEKRRLTQVEAGEIMGLPQSKVSELQRPYRNLQRRTTLPSADANWRGSSVVLEEQPGWGKGNIEVVEGAES